jgi:hypothetical protein
MVYLTALAQYEACCKVCVSTFMCLSTLDGELWRKGALVSVVSLGEAWAWRSKRGRSTGSMMCTS